MLVTITKTFDDGTRRWFSGENPDVPKEVALRWIADSVAAADSDGAAQSWLSSTEVAAARAAASGVGAPKAALLGDSQTRNGQGGAIVTGLAYSAATGLVTITRASHLLRPGEKMTLTVRGAPQWNIYDAPVTVVDANNVTMQLPVGLSGQPVAADARHSYSSAGEAAGVETWLRTLVGDRISFVRNAGVTGETWPQIRARMEAEVAPVLPAGGLLIMQAGHNDTTLETLANSVAAMQSAVSYATGRGWRVIIINCTALGSGFSTTAARVFLLDLNREIRRTAAENSTNVAVVDAAMLSSDQTSQFNSAANMLATDNLHWAPKLTKLIAAACATIIQQWYPSVTRHLPVSHLDCYDATNNPNAANKQQNALLLTTTGGSVTGSMAGTMGSQWTATTDGVSAPASMTASVSAATWGVGNSAKVTWAVSETFTNGRVRIYTSTQHARFAAGQKVRISARVKTTGLATFLRSITLQAWTTFDAATISLNLAHGYTVNDTARMPQDEFDGVMDGVMHLPSNGSMSSFYWLVEVNLNGVIASGTVEVGQASMTVES